MTSQADIDAMRNRLRAELASGDPRTAFERLYDEASRDAAVIPWADQKPNPMLERWLDGDGAALAPPGKCVVVGCGLGDDALHMARRGWRTVGFDFSETAIGWARERFSQLDETLPGAIAWRVADLHATPDDLHGAFDLCVEIYTFQALPTHTRPKSAAGFRKLLRSGGVLLMIARWHDDVSELAPEGPPWAVSMAELEKHFVASGLFELLARPIVCPDPDEPERMRVVAALRAV